MTLHCCGQLSLPGHLWPKELRDPVGLEAALYLFSVSFIHHLVIYEIAQEALSTSLCLFSLLSSLGGGLI